MYRNPLINAVQFANRMVTGVVPFRMGPEPLGMWLYRAYGVPWSRNDIHERVKTIAKPEYEALGSAIVRGGGVPRWNGSLYYPAKVRILSASESGSILTTPQRIFIAGSGT